MNNKKTLPALVLTCVLLAPSAMAAETKGSFDLFEIFTRFWAALDAGSAMDPNGRCGGETSPCVDPNGLQGDEGNGLDPHGLTGDEGGWIDPNGRKSHPRRQAQGIEAVARAITDKGMGLDPNG